MATTVNDIVTLGEQVKAKTIDLQSRLDAIQASLTSLFNANPVPSNASDTYNQLVAQRDAISQEWDSYTGYSDLKDLYTQAAPNVKNDPSVQTLIYSTSPSNPGLEARTTTLVNFARTQKNSSVPNQPSFETVKQKITLSLQAAATTATLKSGSANFLGGGGGGNDDKGTKALSTSFTPPTDGSAPGRRQKNPLGWFSSYTYQISLYMVSAQGYDQFVQSGKTRLPSTGQYYIIAQSGGTPTDKRSSKAPYDFYIDNLRMQAAVGISQNQSQTFTYDISFQIIEPYGFSLPTVIKQIGEELIKRNAGDTSAGDVNKMKNQTKQTFILGIRFLGYDSEGNIMSATNVYDGRTLDPSYSQVSSQGLFERYFDVDITEFKFKLDGKPVTYSIKASNKGVIAAAGIKRGVIDNPFTVQGTYVKDMLKDFLKKINAIEKAKKDDKDIKEINVYKILGVGDGETNDTGPPPPGFEVILNSTMIAPEDVEKNKLPMSNATNIQDSNEGISVKAIPNTAEKVFTFRKSSTILQVINQIIMNSSYLRDALSVVEKSIINPNQNNPNENIVKPNVDKTVKWYNCSPELSKPRFDSAQSDWCYDIMYIIKPYETPVNSSAYANEGNKYPGAFKRYEYWYTGQNSEIIAYDQQLDNTYFNVTLNPNASVDGKGQGGNADISNKSGQPVNYNTQGKTGEGNQTQANYVANISDPGAIAKAKITIFGDPDFLMQPSESSVGLNEKFRKYFGTDGYSINPTSGQVFIEITFKQPIDYDTDKGYLIINDNIIFWDVPNDIKSLTRNAISYNVYNVTSSFVGGKFTQVLECNINTYKDATAPATPAADRTTE